MCVRVCVCVCVCVRVRLCVVSQCITNRPGEYRFEEGRLINNCGLWEKKKVYIQPAGLLL